MNALSILLTCLLAASSLASPVQEARTVDPVEPATLGDASNVHRAGSLFLSGGLEPGDVDTLVERGITRVISLCQDGEVDWDEQGALRAADIRFISIPLRAPDTFTDTAFHTLRMHLATGSEPTLLHCASASRVGGLWIPFRVLDQGVPIERAVAEAKTIGMGNPVYEQRARAYVARQLARTRALEPSSINEGINTSYLDPDLDVDAFVARFETESREIFTSRHAIVASLGLAPGDRVADVGAGTGLFTPLFADSVTPNGWVYAVDIAPRFLQRILAAAEETDTRHLSAVLCPEDSIGLAPSTIDAAFVCDTYHHFEYPRATMTSIHDALRPGGKLVVIDFHRIPGLSKDWVLGHVRAGQQAFRAEIESVGFEHVRDLEVAGLVENYAMEFVRP